MAENSDATPPSPGTLAMQAQLRNLSEQLTRMMRRQDEVDAAREAERVRNEARYEEMEFDNISNGSRRRRQNSSDEGDHRREWRPRHERRRFDRYEDNDRHERRERRGGRDNNLGGIKLKIPPFEGRSDPDAYLDWEMKVNRVFACHNYSEHKKVKLAVVEFTDYAMVWWDQDERERERVGDEPIETWEELKRLMRRRFVPAHYTLNLHDKLQTLKQGNRSVEDYHKEMEKAMIRAGVVESREATLTRFRLGLNPEIRDIVEFQSYVTLQDLVNQSLKAEDLLQRRKFKGKAFTPMPKSNWKDKEKKDFFKGKEWKNSSKGEGSQRLQSKVEGGKKNSDSNPKSSTIKCFKCLGRGHIASECPTKRVMILKGDGNYTSESSSLSSSENSSDDRSEVEEDVVEGEREQYMIRRVLGTYGDEAEETQRENIFHSRCLVRGKVWPFIIDGGSCTNIVSSFIVDKLMLDTIPHPRPYRLHWLNAGNELKVDKQVLIEFSIGRYKDVVLCDVVPMEASHLLFGRPWQFDKGAVHDGKSNKFTLTHEGKKITLNPLSPKEVREEQKMLRGKNVEKEKETSKREKQERKERKVKRGEKNQKERNEMKSLIVSKREIVRDLKEERPMFALFCTSFTLTTQEVKPRDLPSSFDSLL